MEFIEAIKKHNDEICLWHEITNYLAMDPDGRVFGYEKKPNPGILGWSVVGESNSTDGCGCRIELNTDEIDNAWSVCIVTREQYESALSASKPEWDGEGLPQVGCECQIILNKNGDLGACDILFIGSEIFVWRQKSTFAEGSGYLGNAEFRPIRSEADKKCDEAIAEMVKRIGITPESAATCYEICTRID